MMGETSTVAFKPFALARRIASKASLEKHEVITPANGFKNC